MSITPPPSPVLHSANDVSHVYEDSDWKPACFVCADEREVRNTDTHPESLLRNGVLTWLTDGRTDWVDVGASTIELYRRRYVPQTALKRRMQHLFRTTKFNIHKLEQMSEDLSPSVASESLEIRQNIRTFFNYVKTYICKYLMADGATVRALVLQLRSLRLGLGRLSDLPPLVTGGGSRSSHQVPSAGLHVFHLHLDVHWAIVDTLFTTHRLFADELLRCESWRCRDDSALQRGPSGDAYQQAVELLMADLVQLSARRHEAVEPADYGSVSPFVCGCVRELVVMVIHLLQYGHQKSGRESFSVVFAATLDAFLSSESDSVVIKEIDSGEAELFPAVKYADRLGLCWWSLLHVASLHQVDSQGIYNPRLLPQSNYLLLEKLLKRSTTSNEAALRGYMQCCLSLAELWEANTRLVLSVWDSFYKKLNSQFSMRARGVADVACVSKSAAQMLTQCESLVDGSGPSGHLNSYQLFLKLIVVHLRKASNDDRASKWKQLKGRLYSKFHAGSVGALTEVGLHNLSLLFLVLSYVVDLQDVGSKLSELYQIVDAPSLDPSRRAATWRGMFALVLRFVESGRDVGFLTEKLARQFNALCRDSECGGSDSRNLALLLEYVDETQEVIEASATPLHQCHLLGDGFRDLLRSCSENHLNYLLVFVQSLLTRHRMAYRMSPEGGGEVVANSPFCRELADALWRLFYVFVEDHVIASLTPSSIVADVAAAFLLLFIDTPPSRQTGVTITLGASFAHFGWGPQVSAGICGRFLCHLLPNETMMIRLADSLANHERLLVGAWFRCVWLLPRRTEMLREFTRLVMKLGSMRVLFSRLDEEPVDGYEATARQFIRAVGLRFSQLKDVQSKLVLRECAEVYFGGVPAWVAAAVASGAGDTLRGAYHWAGHLVRHCAPVIYVQSKHNCLLPILIDRFVLPRPLLFAKKPVPPHLLGYLAETLPLFLRGLSELDFKRDAYLRRRTSDIVIHLLPRFTAEHSGSVISQGHPLVVALTSDELSEQISAMRQHLLGVMIKEHLGTYTSTNAHNVLMVFRFLRDLFDRTVYPSSIANDCPVVLLAVLSQTLQTTNAAIGRLSSQLVHTMMDVSRRHDTPPLRARLESVVRQFLSLMKAHHGRVLKALAPLSTLHPALMSALLPAVTDALRATEAARGVGADNSLRQLYYESLLKGLGGRGQEEWSRLRPDS